MTDTLAAAPTTGELDQPLVVISSDCHVSPIPETELREYCPKQYLETYDDWLAATHDERLARQSGFVFAGDVNDPKVKDIHTWNLQTAGAHDMRDRLRDLDRDGVAGEIIFHGSAPFQPIPFNMQGIGTRVLDPTLAAVGMRMYNAWLADFCSVEPERHVGLAQLPMWDADAAVTEAEWAHEKGLRGVNFPQTRADIEPYEDPVWEPFWSVCEDRGLTLANHGGGGSSTPRTSGPMGQHIYMAESNALSRVSPVVRLVFGGVFERHPGLRLVQTEQVGDWYGRVIDELDSRWEKWDYIFRDHVPRRPSEYCREQYFVGASFQSHTEAEHAVRDGYADNIMWGSDYPHPEGTFRFADDSDATPITRLAMRNTYSDIPTGAVKAMLGENAVRVYGFDRAQLTEVANRIQAPTLEELSHPIDERPPHWGLAFRNSAYYS